VKNPRTTDTWRLTTQAAGDRVPREPELDLQCSAGWICGGGWGCSGSQRTGCLATTFRSTNHRRRCAAAPPAAAAPGRGGAVRRAFPGKPWPFSESLVKNLGVCCSYLVPNCRLNSQLHFPVGKSWLPDSTVIIVIIIIIILTTVVCPTVFLAYNLFILTVTANPWGAVALAYAPFYFYTPHWKSIETLWSLSFQSGRLCSKQIKNGNLMYKTPKRMTVWGWSQVESKTMCRCPTSPPEGSFSKHPETLMNPTA
jgi:hypothetical protein